MLALAALNFIGPNDCHADCLKPTVLQPTLKQLYHTNYYMYVTWHVTCLSHDWSHVITWLVACLPYVLHQVCPALAMGNTVVLKPASYTRLSALLFAEICAEAGLPPGVFNVVTGNGAFGSKLAMHPQVDKIGFTGSTEVSVMWSSHDNLLMWEWL